MSESDGDRCYRFAREALQQGSPNEALDHIADARAAYLADGATSSALRTDLGRINVVNDLGRHEEAVFIGETLLREVAAMERPVDTDLHDWMIAAAYENTGASYGYLGQHGAAAHHLDAAAERYLVVGAVEDQARVEANLGVERLEMGQPNEALELLSGARDRLIEADEHALARRCLTYSAQAHAIAGRYSDALLALEASDFIDGDDGDERDDIDDLRSELAKAEVYSVLHLWPEVLEVADRIEPRLLAGNMRRDYATLCILKSRASLGTGTVFLAREFAQRAIETLDELGLPARASQARLTLSDTMSTADALVEITHAYGVLSQLGERWGLASAAVLAADRSPETDANEWIERAEKAGAENFPALRWHLDAVRGRVARSQGWSAGATTHYTSSLATLRQLRVDVKNIDQRLPFMSNRREPLEALVSLALDAGDVEGARQVSAEERGWGLATHRSSSTDAAQSTVNTVLFQSVGDQLSAFVTTASGPVFVELAATAADLDRSREQLLLQWRRIADPRMRVHMDVLRSACEQWLQEQYLQYFAPFESLLEPDLPVVLIPTGSMSRLPFQAFHDGLGYITERWNLRVTPSDRHTGRAPRQDGRTLVVGVADSIAPSIEQEALQIAEVTAGTLLLNDDATVEAVREAIQDHDIVHIACHGRFRSENPALSALKLADRWLTASEVSQWDFNDRLVVLAACSSGAQQSAAEDESLGLPRSFLAAGASAVLTSMWPVDDDTSVGVQTQFHGNVRAVGPHEALRTAQRQAASNYPHPLLWASSMVYGSPTFTPSSLSDLVHTKGSTHA